MSDWHSSFSRMRLPRQRDWMTLGEFHEQLAVMGVSLNRNQINRALADNPPLKIDAIKRYRECHLQMAVGYANAMNPITRQEATL